MVKIYMARSSAKNEQMSAALSRLFSSSVYKQLARHGKSAQVQSFFKKTDLITKYGTSSLGNVFDAAFQLSKKKVHRAEYVYKSAITNKILLGTHSPQTASMLSEFRIGTSKADIVVINGTSTVYEIKSERDDLGRLQSQISDYFKVFSRVNVICAEKHIPKVSAVLPECVGIMMLNDRYRISTVRSAVDCKEEVDKSAIFDSLTIAESSEVLRKLGGVIPVVPNTARYNVLKELFCNLQTDELRKEVTDILRKSRSVSHLTGFIEELPESLKPLGVTVKLPVKDRNRLLGVINQPAKNILKWT